MVSMATPRGRMPDARPGDERALTCWSSAMRPGPADRPVGRALPNLLADHQYRHAGPGGQPGRDAAKQDAGQAGAPGPDYQQAVAFFGGDPVQGCGWLARPQHELGSDRLLGLVGLGVPAQPHPLTIAVAQSAGGSVGNDFIRVGCRNMTVALPPPGTSPAGNHVGLVPTMGSAFTATSPACRAVPCPRPGKGSVPSGARSGGPACALAGSGGDAA